MSYPGGGFRLIPTLCARSLTALLFTLSVAGFASPACALALLPFPNADSLTGPVFVQPFAGLQVVSEAGGIGTTEPFFSDLPDGAFPDNRVVNLAGNFQAFDPLGNPTAFDIVGVEVSNDLASFFTPAFGQFNFAGRPFVTFQDSLDLDQVTFFAGDLTLAFAFTGNAGLSYAYRLLTSGLVVGSFLVFDDVEATIAEPAALSLFGLGLIGLWGGWGRGRKKLYPALLALLALGIGTLLLAAPTLTRLNPPIGQPGDVVTITGNNFAADPTQNVVRFGPNRAAVLSASPTQLTVQVPNGQPLGGTQVTVNGSASLRFTTVLRSKIVVPPNPPRCQVCEERETNTSVDTSESARLGATLGGKSGAIYSERGEFYQYLVDLTIPGRPGAEPMVQYTFRREYRAQIDTNGALGHNWNHNYFERLLVQIDGSVLHDDGLGRNDRYLKNNQGEFVSPPEFYTRLIKNPDGTFTLRYRGGTRKLFDSSGRLAEIGDRNDNFMTFHYNPQGQLIRVNDTLGRDILYRYIDSGVNAGRLQEIEDFIGRTVRFTYDDNGDLVEVTGPAVTGTPNGNDFPAGKTTRYTYSAGFADARLNHNLLTITRPNEVAGGGGPVLTNDYGTHPNAFDFDKVTGQTYGGTNASGVLAGGTFTYTYTQLNAGVASDDPNLPVSRTQELDRNGNLEEYEYNRIGYPVLCREFTNRNVRASDPDVYETRMVYNADGRLIRQILPEDNRTEYVYDEGSSDRLRQGNLLSENRFPDARGGDQTQLVTTYTYDLNFNKIKTLTDPRGNDPSFVPPNGGSNSSARYTTTFTYDARGNLVRQDLPTVRLPDGSLQPIITDYAYNAFGQLIRKTDPEGNVDEYFYFPENDPDGDGDTSPGTRPGLDPTTGGYLKEKITDGTTSPRRTETAPPAQISNQFFYDPVGNTIRTIDGRGNDMLYSVNPLNQIVRTQSALPFRYLQDTFYDFNNNVVRIDVENRVAVEADRKPVFTPDDNFQTQAGSPALFTHRLTYDILDHRVQKDEDAAGSTPSRLITQYRYDANENRIRVIVPEGNVFTADFDERDLLFTGTRGVGSAEASTVTYHYDLNGNLTQLLDGEDNNGDGQPDATTRQYDGFDRLIGAIDAVGNRTAQNLDPAGNVIKVVQFGPSGGPSPGGNSGAGNVLLSQGEQQHDELSRVFQVDDLLFTSSGVVTQRPPVLMEGPLTPGDSKITLRMVYDRNSRAVQVTQDDLDTRTAQHDGVDRLVKATDPEGNTRTYTYDANSNLVQTVAMEISQKAGVPGEEFTATFGYDTLDRPVRAADNCQNTQRFAYDSRNNRTHLTDAKADATLGCPGTTNAQGNSTRYTYDGVNRRLQSLQDLRIGGVGAGAIDTGSPFNPDGTITTTSAWDGNGRLKSLTDDNGNTTRYDYDALDRLLMKTFADGTTHTYAYDRDDNLVRFKDNNGSLQNHRYDAIDRPVRTDVTRAPGVIGTTLNTYQYDGLSRPTRITDDNDPATGADDSTVTLAYDSLSRMIEETQNGKAITSDWFGAERRAGLTYPNTRKLAMAYDGLDRLKTVDDAGAPTDIAQYDYFGPGRVLERRLQNGTRLTYLDDAGTLDIGYDPAKRIIAHRHLKADNSLVVGFTHNYDRQYNKRFEEKLHHTPRSELYAYDSVYRVIDFKRGQLTPAKDDIAGLPQKTQSWALDGVGNWRINTVDGAAENRSVNEMNEYTQVGTAPQTHDANGNLTNDGRLGLRWDYANRLRVACLLDPANPSDCSASGAKVVGTYSYDAMDRRIRKVVTNSAALDGTTDFYYDHWQVIEERTGSDSVTQQYVYGIYLDEPLVLDRNLDADSSATGPGDERLFYHQNTLYSVFALTDAGSAISEGYQYDVYGQQTVFGPGFGSPTGAVSARGNPYLFTGQRLDPETGLMYYKNRYYSTALGRFVSRWPNPILDLNAYHYQFGRPTFFTDPYGDPWSWGAVIGGAVIGAVVGTVAHVAIAAATGREITLAGVAGAAAGGAASGAVVGAFAGAFTGDPSALVVAGVAVGISSGAIGGATESIVQQSLSPEPFSWQKVHESATFGAAFGGITGGIAASVSNRLGALFRWATNRPAPANTSALPPKGGVLPVGGSYGEVPSLGRTAHSMGRGLGVPVLEQRTIPSVGPGQTLTILAHGEGTTVGGFTAAQLADRLRAGGFRAGAIELVVCRAGRCVAPELARLMGVPVQATHHIARWSASRSAIMAYIRILGFRFPARFYIYPPRTPLPLTQVITQALVPVEVQAVTCPDTTWPFPEQDRTEADYE